MTPTEVLAFYNSEMRAHPPREAGVKHERVGRILRVCGTYNCILYSDLTSADDDAAIAEQAAFFRAMNAEVEWKVYGHDLPADLGERLRATGFKPDEAETLMAFDLSNPLPINAQAGIEIRRVVDAAGLQDVIVVSNAAFGCDHGWMMQTFGPRVTDPTLSLHVAYSGASPVSAARMELPPGRSFASLWGGGTIPSHRGLGIYRELTKFPDLDPVSIVRGRDVSRQQLNRQEYDRAIWLWNRRTSEVNWLRLLLVLGIGALAHLPLIVLADPLVFCIYHIIYIGIVLVCIGYFMWNEAKLRRWKQDYLRSLARMIGQADPPAR